MNNTQEIRQHLSKTKEEFNKHLAGEEKSFLLELALQTPERKKKVQEIITWIIQALGDEVLDEGDELTRYRDLYDNWNEKRKKYDGELDFGGRLLTLKELLNPPQPTLTAEQEQKLRDYDDLKQENGRLLNRELNDNERRVIISFRDKIPESSLNTRLSVAKEVLTNLRSNDLSVEANPNLSTQGISLPERLVANLEQIVWICEFYLQMEERLNKEIKDLEDRIQELED